MDKGIFFDENCICCYEGFKNKSLGGVGGEFDDFGLIFEGVRGDEGGVLAKEVDVGLEVLGGEEVDDTGGAAVEAGFDDD